MIPAGLKNSPPLLHRLIGAVTAIMPALELMDRDGVNQLPATTERQVVGMLNREDVIASVRTLQELGT